MTLFLAGIIVFFGAHGFSALARTQRSQLINWLGGMPYRGLFSIVSLAGLGMIVVGWSDADATVIYAAPAFVRHITYLLMLFSLILLAASLLPAGKISETVKHPMLTGVKIWAFAHLLVNGEVRSLILFGSFLAFAVVDRISVARREPTPKKGGSSQNDIFAVVGGIAVYILIAIFLHRYIAGVPLMKIT